MWSDMFKPFLTFTFFSGFLALHHWIAPTFIEQYGSLIVMVYMTTDVLCQPEMTTIYRVHHALAVALCVREMMIPLTCHNDEVRRVFIETEWSTLVLQFVILYKHKYLKLLFCILFIYFRIFRIAYVYFWYIDSIDVMRDIPAIGLYIMNCHWFFSILDKYQFEKENVDTLFSILRFLLLFFKASGSLCSTMIVLHTYFFLFHVNMCTPFLFLYLFQDCIISYFPIFILLSYNCFHNWSPPIENRKMKSS